MRKIYVGSVCGRLTVIKDTGKKLNTQHIYLCKCECGNHCEVPSSRLSGNTRSCGCLLKEKASLIGKKFVHHNFDKFNELNKVFKTNIGIISKTDLNKNNKSGYTGVCWNKRKRKWMAYIRFQNKNYHLGYFHDKDDAIKARKMAETVSFEPVLNSIEKEI